jgi:hypothetical protein
MLDTIGRGERRLRRSDVLDRPQSHDVEPPAKRAYRWLAAAARADSPRAVPLLDERALGEAPIAYEGRPRALDATARRSSLLEEAIAGAEWTRRSAARRCGVTQVTAAADLAALVREGRLRVTGAGTKRRYVARLP